MYVSFDHCRFSGLGRLTLIAVTVLVFVGCEQPPSETPQAPVEAKHVSPRAGSGIVLASAPAQDEDGTDERELPELKLRLPSYYAPSQVINANLDIDEIEEQVIVYKQRFDPDDRIRVAIADYDLVRNTYLLSWDGETGANNLRTFAVYTTDVTGDHNLEIVCFGMNNAGEQTLDIFKRTTAPTGLELYYQNVLRLSSDASIEIEDHERSDAYSTGLTTGASFPIVHYAQNQESDNILDLYRTVYYWRSDRSEYVEAGTYEIPGREIEAQQLQELYNSEAPSFEEFLSGPWYRTVGSETQAGREIAFFDPQTRNIVFYDGEIQESYQWVNSYKTIYRSGPGLWMIADNESITTIRRQLNVAVTGIDEIYVTVEGTGAWNGPYQRLTAGLQAGEFRRAQEGLNQAPFSLSGLYKNESGFEIFFSPPRFTMREEDEELHGGFTVYTAGGYVLAMKFLSANGLVKDQRTYAIDFEERHEQNRIIRTLSLVPAKVTVQGVEHTSARLIRLEQIETIESETPEETGQSDTAEASED